MSDNKVLRRSVSNIWVSLILMLVTLVFYAIFLDRIFTTLENFNHRINHVESVVQELIDELAPRLREGALDHET